MKGLGWECGDILQNGFYKRLGAWFHQSCLICPKKILDDIDSFQLDRYTLLFQMMQTLIMSEVLPHLYDFDVKGIQLPELSFCERSGSNSIFGFHVQ
jgi:hypothetical protein